jgi:hypothetical protein
MNYAYVSQSIPNNGGKLVGEGCGSVTGTAMKNAPCV